MSNPFVLKISLFVWSAYTSNEDRLSYLRIVTRRHRAKANTTNAERKQCFYREDDEDAFHLTFIMGRFLSKSWQIPQRKLPKSQGISERNLLFQSAVWEWDTGSSQLLTDSTQLTANLQSRSLSVSAGISLCIILFPWSVCLSLSPSPSVLLSLFLCVPYSRPVWLSLFSVSPHCALHKDVPRSPVCRRKAAWSLASQESNANYKKEKLI